MPSFTRRTAPTAAPPPVGTIISPSQAHPLLPSGIPSLDDLLGGGLPLGGLLLVLSPDQHSAWTRLVARYWLAQALISGQEAVVVGEEQAGRELVQGCMWVDTLSGTQAGEGSESEGEGGAAGEGRGGGKIAWRYDGMGKFKTTTGRSSGLNLMKTIPSSVVSEGERDGSISYVPLEAQSTMSRTSDRTLKALNDRLQRPSTSSNPATTPRATRILVNDLGSADWGDTSSHDIHRFLHSVKELVRSRPIGVVVTLPYHLVREAPRGWAGSLGEWIKSLAWAVDGCIEMRGFADNPALAPHFAPLHGLLTLHSYPTAHALLPPTLKHSTLLGVSQSATNERGGGGAGENNLGFRVKRKGLVIETAHLGIEGGSGERRTAPGDVGAALDSGGGMGVAQGGKAREAEGVETAGEAGRTGTAEAVEVDEGEQGKAKKKDRPRVRFGADDEVLEVQVSGKAKGEEEPHPHDHSHASKTLRPQVRHDRPDLYEF